MMAKPVMIRAKITPAEWTAIRKMSLDRDVPVSQLVGDTLRKSLLKGVNP